MDGVFFNRRVVALVRLADAGDFLGEDFLGEDFLGKIFFWGRLIIDKIGHGLETVIKHPSDACEITQDPCKINRP